MYHLNKSLREQRVLTFVFCRVFFALVFGILAAGQASVYFPNYSKAKLSAKRIFELEDLVPAIDSYSEEGDKPVSVLS